MASLWQPGALSLRSPRQPWNYPLEARPNAPVYSPAFLSLEEVGAGPGITRVVSETTQMFWGKLEWLRHCERRLHQNLKKFTWDGHLPKCLVQGQCGQLCAPEPPPRGT